MKQKNCNTPPDNKLYPKNIIFKNLDKTKDINIKISYKNKIIKIHTLLFFEKSELNVYVSIIESSKFYQKINIIYIYHKK